MSPDHGISPEQGMSSDKGMTPDQGMSPDQSNNEGKRKLIIHVMHWEEGWDRLKYMNSFETPYIKIVQSYCFPGQASAHRWYSKFFYTSRSTIIRFSTCCKSTPRRDALRYEYTEYIMYIVKDHGDRKRV